VFRLGEGDGINVPATLMLLVFAPWSSNRSTPISVTPLMPDVFNLGGRSARINPRWNSVWSMSRSLATRRNSAWSMSRSLA